MDQDFKVTFPGGKRVDAEFKGFVVKTDQPIHQGGDASAPSPFDYFLASIATCSGIYVLSFCQMRKIPTEGITLFMRLERDPIKKMVGKVFMEVNLPREFPEKYQKAVIKAIDGCAVKMHLQDPPEFEIKTFINS